MQVVSCYVIDPVEKINDCQHFLTLVGSPEFIPYEVSR